MWRGPRTIVEISQTLSSVIDSITLLHQSIKEKYQSMMGLQGIETVRRDNCLLVRNIVTTILEMILIERDEKKAKEYVRQTISDLLMNRLDLSLLVITKVRNLSANVEGAYANLLKHSSM